MVPLAVALAVVVVVLGKEEQQKSSLSLLTANYMPEEVAVQTRPAQHLQRTLEGLAAEVLDTIITERQTAQTELQTQAAAAVVEIQLSECPGAEALVL